MPHRQSRVTLLAHTPNATSLIHAAFRQCYMDGSVCDAWDDLVNGVIPLDKQADLIEKVMESGHDSPVEHVSFSFAIDGISRACSHQFVRHRIASFSQQSQRYVDSGSMGWILPPAVAAIPAAKARFDAFMEESMHAYRDIKSILEANGRASKAAEDARFVLPNAASTRLVVTMNCRSLRHFFSLRCCARAQWEIRAVATDMRAACRTAKEGISS